MSLPGAVKTIMSDLNSKGIPLPLLRINGTATLTGTMAVLAFLTCLGGQFAKFTGFLGGEDLSQANYLFLTCMGAYLGRRMQGSGETLTVDGTDQDNKQ